MTRTVRTEELSDGAFLVLRTDAAAEAVAGLTVVPYLGRWNSDRTTVTTGTTSFEPGGVLPLHTHNAEETVLVLSGEATATIGDRRFAVGAGEAMWVPAGVVHGISNESTAALTIYWTYGGRDVTRSLVAEGVTIEAVPPAR